MTQLEAYMELIIESLKKEESRLERQLPEKSIVSMDYVLEGRLSQSIRIRETVERDLNFLRQELLVEDDNK